MLNLPFDKPGQFWRGNLHAHSTVSDGHYEPREVCHMYRRAGYHFLALTEHFLDTYDFPLVDTAAWRGDGFTTILGAELHAGETEFGGKWHILAVGLPLDFEPPDAGEDGPGIAARAVQAGAFVAAAHPQWYTLTEHDILSLGNIHAIEVFNGVAVDDNDRPDSWHITDILLGRGKRYFTYAADDYHGIRQRHDFGRGWVWVKSEHLTPESLLDALKAGHFYSSTGPEIYHVEATRDRLYVRCSPVEHVFVSGVGPGKARAFGHGMIEAELDIAKLESPYLRVSIRDAQDNRAWTNPIWFDSPAP